MVTGHAVEPEMASGVSRMGYTQAKEQLDQVALKADPVLVCDPRRKDNADLMADAHRIGWVFGSVFDATYGEGVFWNTLFGTPGIELTTNDLYKPADHAWDWLTMPPQEWREAFDVVVFDPPYKLNGKPTDGARYGLTERVSVPERLYRIATGARRCSELVAPDGVLLVKCMDQVSLHRVHMQTQIVTEVVISDPDRHWRLIGMLELAEPKPRPQEKQVTPRFNRSTLLAFHRVK